MCGAKRLCATCCVVLMMPLMNAKATSTVEEIKDNFKVLFINIEKAHGFMPDVLLCFGDIYLLWHPVNGGPWLVFFYFPYWPKSVHIDLIQWNGLASNSINSLELGDVLGEFELWSILLWVFTCMFTKTVCKALYITDILRGQGLPERKMSIQQIPCFIITPCAHASSKASS